MFALIPSPNLFAQSSENNDVRNLSADIFKWEIEGKADLIENIIYGSRGRR
jgi:hypothetical protein